MLDNITFCHGMHDMRSHTHTDTQSHTHTHISHAWCIWWPVWSGWRVGGEGGGDFCIDLPYCNTIDPCSEKGTLQGKAMHVDVRM